MDKDNFFTIIECEFCNNIKITHITFYIINIILLLSLILHFINYINYLKIFDKNIIFYNDSIYKDTDNDDDSQFIINSNNDVDIDVNSSFDDYSNSSFDDD